MRVMMCQVNPTIGDLEGNCNIILSHVQEAMNLSTPIDVVMFPEMVTTGYPPRDLLYRQELWDNQPVIAAKVQRLVKQHHSPVTVIYGGIEQARLANGHYARFNVAYIVDDEQVRVVRKRLLPCYDVFDETRYFTPGVDPYTPVRIKTHKDGVVNCDVLICEDIWNADYRGVSWQSPHSCLDDPTQHLVGSGPLFVLNASPFWHGKVKTTKNLVTDIAKRIGRTVFWCNQIGSHDDIVTGGYSMVAYNYQGRYQTSRASVFQTDVVVFETNSPALRTPAGGDFAPDLPRFGNRVICPNDFDTWCSYRALILHIQDYFRRCGQKEAVFGCSGGVDSALVAVLAVDALGSENVTGITMPSKFSSKGSITDSGQLASNLNIRLLEVPIGDIHQAYRNALLSGSKQEFYRPVTDENLQPRARGNILFAYSNDNGWLVLTTGNKSEISMGYCTLYGDMAGGLGVIGDLWKTEVFEMCCFINRYRGEVIPSQIIEKPPSAELRENQQDTDSLPPYEKLDPVLKALVEKELPVAEVQRLYRDVDVAKIWRQYKISEFKRQQMPPNCKLSERAYGSGRRAPIAAKLTLVKG